MAVQKLVGKVEGAVVNAVILIAKLGLPVNFHSFWTFNDLPAVFQPVGAHGAVALESLCFRLALQLGGDQGEFAFIPVPFHFDPIEVFIKTAELSPWEICSNVAQVKAQVFSLDLNGRLAPHIGTIRECADNGKFVGHIAVDGEKGALLVDCAA